MFSYLRARLVEISFDFTLCAEIAILSARNVFILLVPQTALGILPQRSKLMASADIHVRADLI